MAEDYEREARLRILHMNIALAEFEVRPGKQQRPTGPNDEFFGNDMRGRNY
jgi:hypothetical protein